MKRTLKSLAPALVMALALILFYIGIDSLSASDTAKQRELLESSVERSITQCYALEGSYPSSIDYLVEHYGLTYNEEHYFIDYQYIGGNLRPDVTIIERN